MRRFEGAYSVAMIFRDKLVAFRDPDVEPLCIGEVEGGYAVSSETCGLDIIGARFQRGRSRRGRGHRRFGAAQLRGESPRPALCVFEYVYFAFVPTSLRRAGGRGRAPRWGSCSPRKLRPRLTS